MNTRRFLIGTLAGGITAFILGHLIWTLIFAGFFTANAGSAAGVNREAPLYWAVALGTLSLGALVTFVIGMRTDGVTIGAGIRIGAVVGFLLWLGVDFIHYGFLNVRNLTSTLVDPLLEIVRTGIVGAVIAWMLRRVK